MEVQENTVETTESVEKGQADQQEVSEDTIDYESLYKQEVSNSKKLRKNFIAPN